MPVNTTCLMTCLAFVSSLKKEHSVAVRWGDRWYEYSLTRNSNGRPIQHAKRFHWDSVVCPETGVLVGFLWNEASAEQHHLILHDMERDAQIASIHIHAGDFVSLSFDPAGKLLAAVIVKAGAEPKTFDRELLLIDAANGAIVARPSLPALPNALGWSSDGSRLAVALSDSTIQILNVSRSE